VKRRARGPFAGSSKMRRADPVRPRQVKRSEQRLSDIRTTQRMRGNHRPAEIIVPRRCQTRPQSNQIVYFTRSRRNLAGEALFEPSGQLPDRIARHCRQSTFDGLRYGESA
jgi:hypothetical protein